VAIDSDQRAPGRRLANHAEKAGFPQLFANRIMGITKINLRIFAQCNIIALSPLFSSKKIDSARSRSGLFFVADTAMLEEQAGLSMIA
jgi:hypothetical protein